MRIWAHLQKIGNTAQGAAVKLCGDEIFRPQIYWFFFLQNFDLCAQIDVKAAADTKLTFD